MPDYKAPLRDIHFVLNDFLDSEQHFASLSGCEEVSMDVVEAVINEGAKFAENVVSPIAANALSNIARARPSASIVSASWLGVCAPSAKRVKTSSFTAVCRARVSQKAPEVCNSLPGFQSMSCFLPIRLPPVSRNAAPRRLC